MQRRQEEQERAKVKLAREKDEAERKELQKAEAASQNRQPQQQQMATSAVQQGSTAPTERQARPLDTPNNTHPSSDSIGAQSCIMSSMKDREAVHAKYLDLHKRLKQMRSHVLTEAKKIPGLKNQLGDWRRAIQKCCGQLTKDKMANRSSVSIHWALQISFRFSFAMH